MPAGLIFTLFALILRGIPGDRDGPSPLNAQFEGQKGQGKWNYFSLIEAPVPL